MQVGYVLGSGRLCRLVMGRYDCVMLSRCDTETSRFIDNMYITKELWTIQPAPLYLWSWSRNYWPDYNGPWELWVNLYSNNV